MTEFIISSECPKCGQKRVQEEPTRAMLIPLLRTGATVNAYCGACDEHWELSIEERAHIARALNK